MMAKKKEVVTLRAADLGVDASSVGRAGATFELKKLELPPPRPAGKVLSGEVADQVRELVRLLREEAKAI
jgi:electron transfer flavoprotein beta subunit